MLMCIKVIVVTGIFVRSMFPSMSCIDCAVVPHQLVDRLFNALDSCWLDQDFIQLCTAQCS